MTDSKAGKERVYNMTDDRGGPFGFGNECIWIIIIIIILCCCCGGFGFGSGPGCFK